MIHGNNTEIDDKRESTMCSVCILIEHWERKKSLKYTFFENKCKERFKGTFGIVSLPFIIVDKILAFGDLNL